MNAISEVSTRAVSERPTNYTLMQSRLGMVVCVAVATSVGYERRLLLTNRAPRPDDATAAEPGDFLLTGLLPRNFLNR
jgi:hypothetical protein